jgi:predicted negative regulator of RcsB-dependent stress response
MKGQFIALLSCYGELPSLNLSKVYFHTGELDKAKKEAQECFEKYGI